MDFRSEFLLRAATAARAADHIFPEYAACEAALESAWGRSRLALEGNNLFGQKQSHPPLAGTGTLAMPTQEYLQGHWTTVLANWAKFRDWAHCFASRMERLRALSGSYAHYRAALEANSGDVFVEQVSRSWSTDPVRATKVLEIYRAHSGVFSTAREVA